MKLYLVDTVHLPEESENEKIYFLKEEQKKIEAIKKQEEKKFEEELKKAA